MKEIRSNNIKRSVTKFIETFRDGNDDVTKFQSERVVEQMVKRSTDVKGFSSDKVSDRRITEHGVR